MKSFLEYWALRTARKQAKELLRTAISFINYHEDILPASDIESLSLKIQALEHARKNKNKTEIEESIKDLTDLLQKKSPKRSYPRLRENLEIIIVAVAVAMAIRAYFLQPFKIPTGSMQPTLFGIHFEERQERGVTDRFPLNYVKWLITGGWYVEVQAKATGRFSGAEYSDPDRPGMDRYSISGTYYYLPRGAVPKYRFGEIVHAGSTIWSGIQYSGDHVFVNKAIWNFRNPRRGEIMVFSTKGIEGITEGTHYIKRLSGLPEETVYIEPPCLIVNNEKLTSPENIARIAEARDGYAGYQSIGFPSGSYLMNDGASKILGPGQYLALGDNTGNSRDSRYWGPVPQENLLGPAIIVYWPFYNKPVVGKRLTRWGLTD